MQNIQIVAPGPEFTDFMAMPNGIAKNICYYNSIQGRAFFEANLCKKEDGTVYYSHSSVKVKKSKESYYVMKSDKSGFTLSDKGKLSIWFGKNVFQIPHIESVFNYYNFNWLSNKLYPYVTKSIMEKMFMGKITNETEVVKAYFKAMRINASPSLFLQLIHSDYSISKQVFLRGCSVAKDVNHYIMFLCSPKDYIKDQLIFDMIKEALILNKKIDFNWSSNRLREEHKQWTELIMEEEMNSMTNLPIPNVEKLDKYTLQPFKLLKTQKEVFHEGRSMRHCLYTAYWRSIKDGSYIAYHVNHKDEEATLGLYLINNKVTFNQCYSFYNKPVSQEMVDLVNSFIEHLNSSLVNEELFTVKVEEIELLPL